MPWPGNVRQVENVIERLVVTGRHEVVQVSDLPPEIRTPLQRSTRPQRERRRTVADELFTKLIDERESFWTAVYPLYMNREITKGNMRDLIHRGLTRPAATTRSCCACSTWSRATTSGF